MIQTQGADYEFPPAVTKFIYTLLLMSTGRKHNLVIGRLYSERHGLMVTTRVKHRRDGMLEYDQVPIDLVEPRDCGQEQFDAGQTLNNAILGVAVWYASTQSSTSKNFRLCAEVIVIEIIGFD